MRLAWVVMALAATAVSGEANAWTPTADAQLQATALPANSIGQRVVEVEIVVRGARRTKPSAVARLMSTRVGEPLDAATLARDLDRLRKTTMIYDPVVRVEQVAGGVRLTVEVRDKWSAFLYAGVRRGGARTITRVGVADHNVLGRLFQFIGEINSGADVPFVAKSSADRIGSALHLALPRLASTRLTPAFTWTREFFDFSAFDFGSRPTLIYDRSRILYRGGLRWDVTNQISLGAGVGTHDDTFELNNLSLATGTIPPSGRTTSGALELQLGHIEEDLSRFQGFQVNASVEASRRGLLGSDFDTVTLGLTTRSFVVPTRRHNLGLQFVLAGTSSPYDAHLVRAGGLYELRGFLDSTFVAQRILRANLEYRIEAFEISWPLRTIVQTVGFLDGGYVAGRGRAIAGLPYEGGVASAGTGLRGNIVPLARAVGRVDFAFGLHPVRRFDLAFGVQQFF